MSAISLARRFGCRAILGIFGACTLGCASSGPQDPFLVVSEGQLAPNIALGVDSADHQRDWVATDNAGKHLDVAYPANQAWAVLQFWLGLDLPSGRPAEDFSAFNTLQILLDGSWGLGGDTVSIGIQAGSSSDQLLLVPIQARLPAHAASDGPMYYQIDLAQFDRPGEPSPRRNLASPASFYFSAGCGGLLQIYEIALFKDYVRCCASVCTKSK